MPRFRSSGTSPTPAVCLRSQADHTYGYTDALADGVVRPVVFLAYSGETRWRDSAGAEYSARLGEPATAEHHRAGLAHRVGSGRRMDARGRHRGRYPGCDSYGPAAFRMPAGW